VVRAHGDFDDFKPEFRSDQVMVLNYDVTDRHADLRAQSQNL
jgi:hypothetical protein